MSLKSQVHKSLKRDAFFKSRAYNLSPIFKYTDKKDLNSHDLQEILEEITKSQALQKDKSTLYLYFHDNMIQDLGCKFIAQTNYHNLLTLFLINNQITSRGCRYLSKCYFPNLRDLGLAQNNIGDQGCQYLAKGRWRKLSKLFLDNSKITSNGCQILTKGDFSQLTLYVLRNNIGKTGYRCFKAKLWQIFCDYSFKEDPLYEYDQSWQFISGDHQAK